MKSFWVMALAALTFTGCKKLIEDTQENLVVKAMTDGQWRVTSFKRDATDVTNSFSPYVFQFRADETVEAINNGSVEAKGNWKGNAENQTIASFFTNTNPTLSLLNGTWKITNNSWTFVEATQTVNNEVRTLRLDK